MSELEAFIVREQKKTIDHYRQLRDTARSEADRERFQRTMHREEELVRRSSEQEWAERRAA